MLITAGTMLRGPVGDRVEDAAVLVRGGTIVAAGPRTEVEHLAGPGTPRHDHPGATLLPGLINGHVHFCFDASDDPVGAMLREDETRLPERAQDLLTAGVTTVRDLGDLKGRALRLRNAVEAGAVPGPRILAAGTPLTPPGGHCWFFGGEVADERAMRDLVRRNADAGAAVIKVMASGGHITAGGASMWESQFTTAELAAVVDEADRFGLPVAAHAHGTESIVRSITAGVSTVEHCTWLDATGTPERRDDVARTMAERGIAACCTTCGRDWRGSVERLGEQAARELYGRLVWMRELGVPLLPGTDGGVHDAVFDDYAGMLELYEWLGFPAAEVIELATTSAARLLGLAGVTGRIEPGLDADLIVVGGDPSAELAHLHDIRMVVARGRVAGRPVRT